MRIWRRHFFIRIIGSDPLIEFASNGVSRLDDRFASFALSRNSFTGIKSKLCFARLFVRSVASVTSVRQQGLDLEIKGHGLGLSPVACANGENQKEETQPVFSLHS